MIRLISIIAVLALGACGTTPGGVYPGYQPAPGQGVYVVPQYLRPQPTPSLTPVDMCNALLYQGLRRASVSITRPSIRLLTAYVWALLCRTV